MVRALAVPGFAVLLAVASGCGSPVREPEIAVTQTLSPLTDGRSFYEPRTMHLAKSVLSFCRSSVLIKSYENKGVTQDPAATYTLVDDPTATRWKRAISSDSVPVAARTPFRVVGEVKYRCSLPAMIVASVDDDNMNQSETGGEGNFYQVEIASGPAAKARALWKPTEDAVYADTGKRCFAPLIARDSDACPVRRRHG